MSKDTKGAIMVIGVAVLITVIIFIATIGRNTEKENTNTENQVVEEFVEVLEDGTKLNKSEKLHETKKLEGLEIGDLQLTESGNMTLLLGTITNTSNTVQGGYIVNLTVVNKEGKEIETVEPYIPELQPGESTQLNANATRDFANAYDFTVTKK